MNLASASIYTDFQGLSALKAQAAKDAEGSLDVVARQFEALMMQQMLKSMRQASIGDGLFDNDQSLFYRDMYDQQLAIHLSEHGGFGLADVIKRQLGGAEESASAEQGHRDFADYLRRPVAPARQAPGRTLAGVKVSVSSPPPETAGVGGGEAAQDPSLWSKREFVERLWPWAREAASLLGLRPQALLAQAALESGWGKHLMRFPDGMPANNLFGIKADHRWQGNRVAVDTLEYEQGVAVRKPAFFRAYDSLRDSFNDYVAFVKGSPRYQQALRLADDSTAYFTELQRAGYATDPDYAQKINRILNDRVMRVRPDEAEATAPRPL